MAINVLLWAEAGSAAVMVLGAHSFVVINTTDNSKDTRLY